MEAILDNILKALARVETRGKESMQALLVAIQNVEALQSALRKSREEHHDDHNGQEPNI